MTTDIISVYQFHFFLRKLARPFETVEQYLK